MSPDQPAADGPAITPPEPPADPQPQPAPAAAQPPAAPTPDDLQAQLAALHDEMAQQVTVAAQLRADLETQLAESQTSLTALSEQLTTATANQVEAIRRATIAENAGQIIPELVTGTTAEEIAASVTLARDAFARVAQDLRTQAAAQVPTGASPIAPPPIEDLSPMAKIAAALSRGGANNR